MKTLINNAALVLLSIFAISCSGDDTSTAATPVPTVKDVYIAGFETTASGTRFPVYWKNGTQTILTNFAGGSAESIFVSGTDVYVAGYTYGGGTTNAAFWKNNSAVALPTSSESYATGIFVSGADVYVCGYEMYIGKFRARYWKNGVVYNLSDGTKNAYAQGIFVSGTDVYVCGYERSNSNFTATAKYWKNGVAVNLTPEANGCNATAIEVVGSDIYVSGREGNDAVYWKNGTKTIVSTPVAGSYFQGDDIALNGGDIYVAGWEETPGPTQGRIWKNGVATNLNNFGQANGICVSPSGDVYAVGRDNANGPAKFWLNAVPTTLASAASTASAAQSIFLTYN